MEVHWLKAVGTM